LVVEIRLGRVCCGWLALLKEITVKRALARSMANSVTAAAAVVDVGRKWQQARWR
jgi:hypothetical protein